MLDASAGYNRVAVFIDVENLVISADNVGLPVALGPVIDRIREEGQIVFVRGYGDWAQPHISRYLDEFRRHTFEMTQLPTAATGKNTADVQLALDALEMTLLESAPDMIVIISGDRDFVPVVQKIKRYGKTVMGIGVKGSTSNELAMACNSFLFADDVLGTQSQSVPPPTQADRDESVEAKVGPSNPHESVDAAKPVAVPLSPRERKAFVILARAVTSLVRQGQQPLGSNVRLRMQQLDPAFYPERLKFSSFKDFVQLAEKAGYVKTIPTAQGDFRFDSGFAPSADLMAAAGQLPEEDDDYAPEYADLDFETSESACRSYHLILQRNKRLELVPWAKREKLVRQLWLVLPKHKEGMTLQEMVEELRTFVLVNQLNVEDKAVELIVRTLCIARCFETEGDVPNFHCQGQVLRAAVDVEEAIMNMHYTYVNGVRLSISWVPLHEEAVALFLFGEVNDFTRTQAGHVIERVSGGDERSAPSAIEEAYEQAKKRKADGQI